MAAARWIPDPKDWDHVERAYNKYLSLKWKRRERRQNQQAGGV